MEWCRQSAEQGNVEAQVILGHCYSSGYGGQKDLSKALEWYRKAADNGNADAQYELGLCYHYGRGVTANINEALEWYRKAAARGHAEAQRDYKYYKNMFKNTYPSRNRGRRR